ncbi:MAG: hypothetical protein GTN62_12315 [Gemmatimonadales bacterium]|nr:hypothetical protein [Gemmatimonadales bacterium]NIN12509.1 hypothetical protein [Gemmatimonadales bacterium]NIN50880.1 hypothetical protein [Gemmatimonadales bacterium]NIP08344.1 hypothetical protein [Gemmatimonadales bacterium]
MRTLTGVLSIGVLLCSGVSVGRGQGVKVDLQALVEETQQMSRRSDAMTFVWWMPEEFWRASLAEDSTIPETAVEEFVEVLRPYIIVVAVDGRIGPFGGITYEPEATVRANIRLVDRHGGQYPPMGERGIDPDTRNFLSMMKPFLANLLGPMGQNMNFFVFPSKTKKGQTIADATEEGSVAVRMRDEEFRWRLPLGSLVPPKICPVDGERLNGAWRFCPWHGVELVSGARRDEDVPEPGPAAGWGDLLLAAVAGGLEVPAREVFLGGRCHPGRVRGAQVRVHVRQTLASGLRR